jgi:DNA-directed RNA polymerase specialized sigma24 family protein
LSDTLILTRAVEQLRAEFEKLLPKVETVARHAFRAIRCPHSRDDAVAEVLGLAWRQFLHYARRNIDPSRFPLVFARRLVASVNDGRRTARQDRRNDILSPRAYLCHGLKVIPLGNWSDTTLEPWREALTDDAETPVPDQVAFRLDFHGWLKTLKPRHREIVGKLLSGERSRDIAREMGLSRQYFCRLRAALHLHWLAFQAGSPFRSVRDALLCVWAG